MSARKVTIKATAAAAAAIAVGAISPAAASATSASARDNRPRHHDNLVICKDVRGHFTHESFSFFVSGYGKVKVRDDKCTSVQVKPGRTWVTEARDPGYRLRSIAVFGDRHARVYVGYRTAVVRVGHDERVVVRFVNERMVKGGHGR